MSDYGFKIIKQSDKNQARIGQLILPHGNVETPCFMPDATYAYIKALPFFIYNLITPPLKPQTKEYKKMIVINTLHSYINILESILKDTNGLFNFIGSETCILTDSGGFQVYSLGIKQGAKITSKGIEFKNPRDGKKLFYSPQIAMNTQNLLKSDIRVALDYFTNPQGKKTENERSVDLTTEWAQTSKSEWENGDQNSLLMAVVQGDTDLKLREKSYLGLSKIGFDGYGFGGWPLTQDKKLDLKTLQHFCKLLTPTPINTPFRYAMGIGTPDDIKKCIEIGFDLFDTVLPTRNARHGYLFTNSEPIRIKSAQYQMDYKPIDPLCKCITCQKYTRAYLHYLFRIKSDFGFTLATIHNIAHFEDIIEKAKNNIKNS